MEKKEPLESTTNDTSIESPTSPKIKPKNRGKKRKRIISNSSSDIEDVMPENLLEIEKNVHASAVKNNLDDVSHVDPGESDWITALRETKEEAGLTENDLEIYKDISKMLHYNVKGKPKVVVYWLAKLKDPQKEVKLSNEHQDLKWLPVQQAQDLSGFEDMKKLLAEFYEKAQKL
ncbi:bis(5'-nucleosyl)-tetraphosphatase [asymmetrical]-like [Aphomia sociella]